MPNIESVRLTFWKRATTRVLASYYQCLQDHPVAWKDEEWEPRRRLENSRSKDGDLYPKEAKVATRKRVSARFDTAKVTERSSRRRSRRTQCLNTPDTEHDFTVDNNLLPTSDGRFTSLGQTFHFSCHKQPTNRAKFKRRTQGVW